MKGLRIGSTIRNVSYSRSEKSSISSRITFPSRGKYVACWGKENESEQCHSWRDAGWEVESVDLKGEEVAFRKISPH